MKDYYKILDLKEQATLHEVKSAYRKLSKKYHPDANSGNKTFVELFRDVQEAYDVLSDEPSRTAYNQELKYYRFELNTQKDKMLQATLGKEEENLYRLHTSALVVGDWLHQLVTNKYTIITALGIVGVLILLLASKPDTGSQPAVLASTIHTANADSFSTTASKLEEQKKYWSRFRGNWLGSGTTPLLGRNFTIKLTADFGKNTFVIEYPNVGFSGDWELIQMDNQTAVFKETIKSGLLNTTQVGTVNLTVLNDNELDYKYYFPHKDNLFAEGVLKR